MKFLQNNVKKKLRDGELVVGSWLSLPCLETAEIMARSGFDFLVIDMEHGPFSLETAQKICMVIEGYGVPPFVRVSKNDPVVFKQVLDMGCYGIIAPNVTSRQEVLDIVSYTRYEPHGVRGTGLSRAQGYGLDLNRYIEWFEENFCLVIQIESMTAIMSIDKILQAEGFDASMIGPYDLAASLKSRNAMSIDIALHKYTQSGLTAGKPSGCHVVLPNQSSVQDKIREGYRFIVHGVDETYLATMASQGVWRKRD